VVFTDVDHAVNQTAYRANLFHQPAETLIRFTHSGLNQQIRLSRRRAAKGFSMTDIRAERRCGTLADYFAVCTPQRAQDRHATMLFDVALQHFGYDHNICCTRDFIHTARNLAEAIENRLRHVRLA